MLNMQYSKMFDYCYRRGSVGTQLQTISLTCRPGLADYDMIGMCVYSFTPGNNPAMYTIQLFASNATIPSGTTYGKYNANGAGSGGTGTVIDGTYAFIALSDARALDSVSAASSTPTQLTELYNGLYGTSKTNAEIYALLKSIYGDYESFCFATMGGTGAFPFVGGNSYNQNFYQDPSSTTVNIDKCVAFTGGTIPDAWQDSFTGTEIALPQDMIIDTVDKLAAWVIFSQPEPENELDFDVYLDGTTGPNIAIRWHSQSGDANTQLVNPMVWCRPKVDESAEPGGDDPSYSLSTENGIKIVNENYPQLLKYINTWPGDYTKDYIGQFNACTSGLSNLEKSRMYDDVNHSTMLYYYLRFNMQAFENNQAVLTWGDLYTVQVPYDLSGGISDVIVTKVTDSDKNPNFITKVNIISGQPPEDEPDDDPNEPDLVDPAGDPSGIGPYDPNLPIPDLTAYNSTGFPGFSQLTTTYAMAGTTLKNVGNKMWTQSYFDVLKIQSNPIENVISCKWYPMNLSGTAEDIIIGDVNFGIQGDNISSIYTKTIGTWKYTTSDSRPGYLSCSPYTTIKLHLPYCGTVQLDASEILNRTLSIQYIVDLVTGEVLVLITMDNSIPLMEVSGKMGVDIPLTSSNRIQTELSAASRAMSAAIGAAGHIAGGDVLGAANEASGIISMMGIDYNTQRTATHSACCATYANRAIYAEVSRPNFDKSNGYESRHGRPYHKYVTLKNLSGYVVVDTRTTINIAMTEEENRMLEQIMTTGFYL